jgi:hypothetical protein
MKGAILLLSGRGHVAGNPITNEIELAQFIERECGASGYRIEGGQLIALNWDRNGSEIIVERFELAPA